MSLDRTFTTASNAVARAAGAPTTFLICCVVVIVWGVSGPFFGFSDTWQLVINTGTTIVTFLMVFLIQNTQNRDGAAIQVLIPEEAAPQFRDDVARRNGMMPPPDSEMIAPPITE